MDEPTTYVGPGAPIDHSEMTAAPITGMAMMSPSTDAMLRSASDYLIMLDGATTTDGATFMAGSFPRALLDQAQHYEAERRRFVEQIAALSRPSALRRRIDAFTFDAASMGMAASERFQAWYRGIYGIYGDDRNEY